MKTTIEVDLKWFRFSQNNSGGHFVVDENVCEEVFVQARSADEAIAKAETFCDNSDSCPCCGDRWSFRVDEDDIGDEPTLYGELLSSMKKDYFRKQAKLHHFDGRVETFVFPD
ncbi:hypothetical protein [Paraburkholderia fungorum]|uniref:DUF7296 family protein n=1 Tax=Paraburkholderia fungorum TaxID=134537 RepID=UPI0038783E65